MAISAIAQQSLFTPTAQGEQPTIQERLLHRRTDPETSKDSAKIAALGVASDESEILAILRIHGRQNIREIASHAADPSRMYFTAAKRLPRMSRAGLVMVAHDREGREVVRDGGRCWEACE